MKKALSLILAALLIFSGCGNTPQPSETEKGSTQTAQNTEAASESESIEQSEADASDTDVAKKEQNENARPVRL